MREIRNPVATALVPASDVWNVPPFHHRGALATETSDRWYHPVPLALSGMLAALTAAGLTTSTVILLKNGVAIPGASISFTAGQNGLKVIEFTAVSFTIGTDYLTSAITAAGTDAAGLIVRTV